jgi:hypothetical protein
MTVIRFAIGRSYRAGFFQVEVERSAQVLLNRFTLSRERAMSELLTKGEACELLRCSPRTFDRWRSMWKAKGIDVGEVKIRKKVRFRRDRLERLINTPKLWLTSAAPRG